MSRWRDLPFAVWVLIGFLISFSALGGGVLLARAGDDDEGRADATASTATTSSTATTAPPPTSTTTTPPPAPTTTAPPTTAPPDRDEPGLGGLTVGELDGFDWLSPDHPPFPFPAPASVRGRVEEDDRCPAADPDRDDDEPGSSSCLTTLTFTVEIEQRDATVDDVVAFLQRFPTAAGWSPTSPPPVTAEGAEASAAFSHSCGTACDALVQIDIREPERRNRGPQLEVVVTFSTH